MAPRKNTNGAKRGREEDSQSSQQLLASTISTPSTVAAPKAYPRPSASSAAPTSAIAPAQSSTAAAATAASSASVAPSRSTFSAADKRAIKNGTYETSVVKELRSQGCGITIEDLILYDKYDRKGSEGEPRNPDLTGHYRELRALREACGVVPSSSFSDDDDDEDDEEEDSDYDDDSDKGEHAASVSTSSGEESDDCDTDVDEVNDSVIDISDDDDSGFDSGVYPSESECLRDQLFEDERETRNRERKLQEEIDAMPIDGGKEQMKAKILRQRQRYACGSTNYVAFQGDKASSFFVNPDDPTAKASEYPQWKTYTPDFPPSSLITIEDHRWDAILQKCKAGQTFPSSAAATDASPYDLNDLSVCKRYAAGHPVTRRYASADMNKMIYLWRGDITSLEIDAIVNAAKDSLMGGGGIDGAIHRAAGPLLKEACASIPISSSVLLRWDKRIEVAYRCRTGDAVITRGFALPAKYVVHTVGPIGRGDEELISCYRSTLDRIHGHNKAVFAREQVKNSGNSDAIADGDGQKDYNHTPIRSVALCGVSTGIFGFPLIRAAHLALETVRSWLEEHSEEGYKLAQRELEAAKRAQAKRLEKKKQQQEEEEEKAGDSVAAADSASKPSRAGRKLKVYPATPEMIVYGGLHSIIFCCFTEKELEVYRRILPLQFPLDGSFPSPSVYAAHPAKNSNPSPVHDIE